MKSIVLTGGGTAGHVMPSMALLPYLRKYFGHISYIGRESGVEQRLASLYGLPYFGTQTVRFERTQWWKNIRIPAVLHSASCQVSEYLGKVKPSVVFSKGGYCALPTVLAAHKLRIPVVCHESDYSIGLANRLSLRFTPYLLTSFADTPKGICMGNPVRDEIWQGNAANCPSFAQKRPVLLVMGGSLGAKAINQALVEAMPSLGEYNVVNVYGNSPIPYNAPNYIGVPYLDNIGDYLALADVVLCRAGANTLFELAALGKPCVMVPLPKGDSRGDQVQNARYFASHYGFVLLKQDDLCQKNILSAVMQAQTTLSKTRYVPQNAAIADYLANVAEQARTHGIIRQEK